MSPDKNRSFENKDAHKYFKINNIIIIGVSELKSVRLLLFIPLLTISIICFTFASWILYLGLSQSDIPMQLFAIITFALFSCLGILFIIIIICFPLDCNNITFRNHKRLKYLLIQIWKKKKLFFLFVLILWILFLIWFLPQMPRLVSLHGHLPVLVILASVYIYIYISVCFVLYRLSSFLGYEQIQKEIHQELYTDLKTKGRSIVCFALLFWSYVHMIVFLGAFAIKLFVKLNLSELLLVSVSGGFFGALISFLFVWMKEEMQNWNNMTPSKYLNLLFYNFTISFAIIILYDFF